MGDNEQANDKPPDGQQKQIRRQRRGESQASDRAELAGILAEEANEFEQVAMAAPATRSSVLVVSREAVSPKD